MKTIQFRKKELVVDTTHKYQNGRIAITLDLKEDMSPYMVASVNLPNAPCPEGHTFIKDWSENEGILEELVSSGVVELTGTTVETGFVYAHLVKVL